MCDKQQASRGRELVRMRRNAESWIETGVEALAQFGEVLLEAPSGIRARWIGDGDLHHGCDQKPLDLCHRCRELHTLALAQRFQERTGKRIGSVIQLSPLAKACIGELDMANSSIVLARPNHDQALPLERTQQ